MRKFFCIIRIFIKAFSRRTIWMTLLTLGLLFTLGCYIFVYRSEPYHAINQTSYGQVILTLVFMMMGIELKREQQRENIDDITIPYLKNVSLIPWGQILAIVFFDLMTTLPILAECYVRMTMDKAPALWIEQSLAYIVLLYFLPCLILGVWGLLIAQWNKGKSVYLPALLGWLYTSTVCTYFTDYTKAMGLGNGGFFFNMLNMGINNFHIPGNLSIGMPIELPRWIVCIGILIFLVALFLCDNTRRYVSTYVQKRNAWIRMVFVIICGGVLVTFFYQKYNVFFTRFADPEDVRDYVVSKYNAGKSC